MIISQLPKYCGVSVIDNNTSYSFADLSKQIEFYKININIHIKNHETVVIRSDYNFYSISLFLSLLDKSINIVPLIKSSEKEFEDKLNSCNPSKIISLNKKGNFKIIKTKHKYDNSFKMDEVYSKSDTGLILFSSGTSGAPKLMIQNLSSLISNLTTPKRQKKLVFLLFLMFDHIGGLNTLLNCLINGSTIVIPKDRNPNTIIKEMSINDVNVLPTSPTFLNLMLMDETFINADLSSLRLVTYGTERMSANLLKRLNHSLPKVRFLQTFGTSETGILKTKSKSSNSLFFKIEDPEKEYKIIEKELYLKSKTSIKGYLNHENSSFKNNGWFATGDLVEEDQDGFIKIIGRKNKIINIGGLKLFPSEVENIINSLEGVIDSSVYGEENVITGNIVCAKVYTEKSVSNYKDFKKTIKTFCRINLEKYKIPSKIIFANNLKMTIRGKKI